MQLLERNMGHPVPVPKEASHPDNAADKVEQSILTMNRWLRLCDMAITSHMMRDELQQHDPGHETVEALLRHYMLKASPIDVDRDKTDYLGAAQSFALVEAPGQKRLCRRLLLLRPQQGAGTKFRGRPEADRGR